MIALVVGAVLYGANAAEAQCPALPYQITNGQVTDAAHVMANFETLLDCVNLGEFDNRKFTGPGGGVVTVQNPSAMADYNFNLPASAGTAGDLLTSGGGGANPETWTTPGADLLLDGGTLELSTTTVTSGSYTLSNVTVDAKGRLTAASSGASTGTSGHVLPFLDGANAWSGMQAFGPVIGTVSTQAGTSYTLAASDCGTTILFTNNSPITLTTLNSLPIGCAIAITQKGSGQITVAAGSGASQHSAHSFTKTYGQYAILGLFVDVNDGGAAAHFIITGDGA